MGTLRRPQWQLPTWLILMIVFLGISCVAVGFLSATFTSAVRHSSDYCEDGWGNIDAPRTDLNAVSTYEFTYFPLGIRCEYPVAGGTESHYWQGPGPTIVFYGAFILIIAPLLLQAARKREVPTFVAPGASEATKDGTSA